MEVPKIVFYTLIGGIIIISLIFIFAMKDSNACISNPMVYGAEKAITRDSGEILCACTFTSPNYAPFYFNDKNISINRDLSS